MPPTMAQLIRTAKAATVACTITLAGCLGTDYADLDNYVQEVKAKRAARVAPLPDFKTYESYAYTSFDLRDPFQPDKPDTSFAAAAEYDGLRPDSGRHREALEAFPLDTLKFVGSMERDGRRWAFVSAPDQLVHQVQVGNYLGQNHGRIQTISETEIAVTEILPDSIGGWFKRDAALVLFD